MKSTRSTARQQGFTITQMVITLAIISVVSTFGVLGIRTARAEFRLQNSARLFATYVEKARADAIRRHASSGSESSIETFGPGTSSYAVTMDWGSGTVETRTFDLESGLSFNTVARKISFDWRGRITEAWVFQVHSDYLEKNLPVDVSGSGDITVGEQHFPDQLIPEIVISQIPGDVDSNPTPTPAPEVSPTPDPGPELDPDATPTPTPPIIELDPDDGGGGGGEGDSSPTPTPTPTPIPTPTPTPTPTPNPGNPAPPPCSTSISPSTLSLSQSDPTRLTGTAVFTISSPTGVRTIDASLAGNGNSLNINLSLVRIDGSGNSIVTITTKNGAGNRGVFIVNVTTDPDCGSPAQLTVSVSSN